MGTTTKIEWADHSASPWHGCVEVTDGCTNCYAREMAKRNPATLGVWGTAEHGGTRVRSKSFWDNCRRWNKAAANAGRVETVFPSICDPFEDWQGPISDQYGNHLFVDQVGDMLFFDPTTTTSVAYAAGKHGKRLATLDDLRRDLFALIDETPNLFYLLLTKRPENVLRMWRGGAMPRYDEFDEPIIGVDGFCDTYRRNVAIITSISDQPTADAMIPPLLECRDLVPVLGLSCEPLLGPVNLADAFGTHYQDAADGDPVTGDVPYNHGIDWVIVGGESGPNARPCNVEWIRSLRDQCAAAEVPCFVKQLGSAPRPSPLPSDVCVRAIRDKKGGDWNEWPSDLRVRQYPAAMRHERT